MARTIGFPSLAEKLRQNFLKCSVIVRIHKIDLPRPKSV
jgi:hypothetical protein